MPTSVIEEARQRRRHKLRISRSTALRYCSFAPLLLLFPPETLCWFRAGTLWKRGQCDAEHTEQGCALKTTVADARTAASGDKVPLGYDTLREQRWRKTEAFLHTFFAGKKYGTRSEQSLRQNLRFCHLPLHKGGLTPHPPHCVQHLPLKGKAFRCRNKGGLDTSSVMACAMPPTLPLLSLRDISPTLSVALRHQPQAAYAISKRHSR